MLEDDELRLDGACAIQRRFSVFAVWQFRKFVFRFCADLFEQWSMCGSILASHIDGKFTNKYINRLEKPNKKSDQKNTAKATSTFATWGEPAFWNDRRMHVGRDQSFAKTGDNNILAHTKNMNNGPPGPMPSPDFGA